MNALIGVLTLFIYGNFNTEGSDRTVKLKGLPERLPVSRRQQHIVRESG